MSAEEVREKVLAAVRERTARPEEVNEGTLFENDLGLDYLDRLEIVIDLEDALDVTFEDDAPCALKAVGDLVREAQERVANGYRVTDVVTDRD